MGLHLPSGTCLRWVGPPSNLGVATLSKGFSLFFSKFGFSQFLRLFWTALASLKTERYGRTAWEVH